MFHGSLLYPISIRQGGEQIYQISVEQVAGAQYKKVNGDLVFLCIVLGFCALLLVLGSIRRRMRRIA